MGIFDIFKSGKRKEGDFARKQRASPEEADPREENAELKPVLFPCMQCGGSLRVTVNTPRVMSCNYCGASQYLPDKLRRALHPAKKKREWFVRWSKA